MKVALPLTVLGQKRMYFLSFLLGIGSIPLSRHWRHRHFKSSPPRNCILAEPLSTFQCVTVCAPTATAAHPLPIDEAGGARSDLFYSDEGRHRSVHYRYRSPDSFTRLRCSSSSRPDQTSPADAVRHSPQSAERRLREDRWPFRHWELLTAVGTLRLWPSRCVPTCERQLRNYLRSTQYCVSSAGRRRIFDDVIFPAF